MHAHHRTNGFVVAVDGPSGSGKSSTARGVARRLGLRYLDTGAMYRAVTWWMLQHDVPVGDAEAVAAHTDKPDVVSGTDPDAPSIHVDGTDVATQIRTREVTEAVSPVSAVPEVRARLVDLQRRVISEPGAGIVVEGRDIGTVVCPDAGLKVFLTADPEARATRRNAELTDAPVTVEETQAALARRDAIDSGRKAAPLMQADDAVVLDTTMLSLEQAIQTVVDLVEGRRGA
ncbi:MAG: (d)CMP kinase [Actinomycetota bacterium]|nr:(d)CMP kinase [Actinomycetota bacterium]